MDQQADDESLAPGSERSRHSSILGPYRQLVPKTQFPIYHPIATSSYQPAVYCRSLMSTGRGFPLSRLAPSKTPEVHFQQGLSIGDVGYLDRKGGFQYRFNIFYARDHPMQHPFGMPRNFRPIDPPLPQWKIHVSTTDIEPGGVIASEGVAYRHISEEPLEIEFTSYARDGAVLILPEGITREDLTETHKLYPYLKEHASDWYQCLNSYSDTPLREPKVNSCLILVTGTDKARIWNKAQFPRNWSSARPFVFQYIHAEERSWEQRDNTASVEPSDEMSTSSEGKYPCALFFRGISIALSKPAWTHGVAPIPVDKLPVYYIPSVPAYGRRANLERFIQPFRRFWDRDVARKEVIFHPAMVLSQLLLDAAPTAEIAIVEDSIWCSAMLGQGLTLARFIKLVHGILADHEITITDDVVHFVRKNPVEANLSKTFHSYIWFLRTRSRSERNALQKLKEVLSKP